MNRSDHAAIIHRLRSFNAKERYWVVHEALGHFQPSEEFLQRAAKAAGAPPPEKGSSGDSNLFLAMDYHLNWLCAALWTSKTPLRKARVLLSNQRLPCTERDKMAGLIGVDHRALLENSQEDVDLLIAYPRADGVTQLIVVEAKCAGAFTSKQLKSKLARLKGIIGALGSNGALSPNNVDIRMILMSPDSPRNADARTELAQLAPDAPSDTSFWMPLKTCAPDSNGFWFVKFGGSDNENAESRIQRQQAGKTGESWYWPEPSLQYRKFGTKNDQGSTSK